MTDFTKDIEQCLTVLHAGGILLYPTDTIWGLGCDVFFFVAVVFFFVLFFCLFFFWLVLGCLRLIVGGFFALVWWDVGM